MPPPFLPAGAGGPPRPGPARAPPAILPRPGRGIDPREAMMFGLGDLSHLAPPPPAPGAPTGPDGLPVGGSPASSDPGFDRRMGGSTLLQALNMQLDPYAGPPSGHGELGEAEPSQLDTLLALLAMQQAGTQPSGATGDAPPAGMAMGLRQYNLTE